MGEANSRQVGGNHYKHGGEEHWDRVCRLGLDYFQAQITKYIERCKLKNGIEDLKKARHFLDKYIELHNRGAKFAVSPNPHLVDLSNLLDLSEQDGKEEQEEKDGSWSYSTAVDEHCSVGRHFFSKEGKCNHCGATVEKEVEKSQSQTKQEEAK
jgi:hypothetical protein